MQELELRLTVDEVNIIFAALGKRPFEEVFALIAKMQEQAQQQLNGSGPMRPAAPKPAAGGQTGVAIGDGSDG